MNIDITFCSNIKCKNMECKRNQKHLEEFKGFVSMGKFKECEYWEEDK